jgi:uncharacterized DUF497 family protein
VALPAVYSFEWDEVNAEHIAEHGISDIEVDQMLSNAHIVVPNRGHEPRMFLLGRSNGGRALTVVIEPTRMEGTWRPITAWDADASEERRLKEATGG